MKSLKTKTERRSETGIRLTYDAERERNNGSHLGFLRAEEMDRQAVELMAPGEFISGGGEVIAEDSDKVGLLDTVRHPESVNLDASEQRMSLAAEADVLALAVDAAQTIVARNSLEKMLAGQMAAAHSSCMKLIARADNDKIPIVETVRLTNGAARLMDSFQSALLTLQKLRTGGNQKILVQHVNVNNGGQAVIAGGDVGATASREVNK